MEDAGRRRGGDGEGQRRKVNVCQEAKTREKKFICVQKKRATWTDACRQHLSSTDATTTVKACRVKCPPPTQHLLYLHSPLPRSSGGFSSGRCKPGQQAAPRCRWKVPPSPREPQQGRRGAGLGENTRNPIIYNAKGGGTQYEGSHGGRESSSGFGGHFIVASHRYYFQKLAFT